MFDASAKKWAPLLGALGQPIPASNTDSGTPQYNETNFGDLGYTADPGDFMGSGGLNDKFLANLGWTGGNPYINAGAGQTTDGGQAPGAAGGYTPEFQQFLQDKGLNFQTAAGPDGHTILGAFGPDGNQVGTNYLYRPVNEDAFLGAAVGGAGFAGAAALGAGAGAAGGAGVPSGSVLPTGGGITADQAAYGALENGAAYGGGAGDSLVASAGGLPEGALPAAGGSGGMSSTDLATLYGDTGYGTAASPVELGAGGGAGLGAGATAGGGGGVGSTLSDIGSWAQKNPLLTNLAGSAVNGLIGTYAAGKATDAARAAQAAADARLAPWYTAGANALGGIDALLKDPSSITKDPAYGFEYDQGMKAATNGAASRGMAYSGAQDKALTRFGQGLASTRLQDSFNRLATVAGLGAPAAQAGAAGAVNTGQTIGNADLYTGALLNQGINNSLGQWNYSQFRKPTPGP